MRAFPRRYRDAHEVEMLSTLAEAEAGRRSPCLGTAIDLVRAGWSERIRSHPPFRRYIWYRLGGKLPPEYRSWMLDDLNGWYRMRTYICSFVLSVIFAAA